MSLLYSYPSTSSYSRFKDEEEEGDGKRSKGRRRKSNKINDASNSSHDADVEDDDDVEDDVTYCCSCWTITSKIYPVDNAAIQGCSGSMEGSTLSRRSNSIRTTGPEYYSYPAIKGIKNLGNTCYLNSVLQCIQQSIEGKTFVVVKEFLMQCLNQTVEFCKLLSDGAHPAPPNQTYLVSSLHAMDSRNKLQINVTDSKLGRCGKELYYFIHGLNSSESPSVVSPNKLLSRIRQKEQRFQGNNPQDSHEIFRVILDCIRFEEAEVIKNGILDHFGETKKSYEHCDDEEKKKKIKGYLFTAEKCCKLLNKVFVGSVINMIICRECHAVLKMYEEVLDLSIPAATRAENTSNCYNNSFQHTSSSSYLTATGDTNALYADAEDQMNIISKSPTYTLASSHQGSYASSQCEMELSMRQTPKNQRRSSPMQILTRIRSLSRSLNEPETQASRSGSVHTEIIRIPQVPPISEGATSMTRSVDKNNSSVNNSVVEHPPYVSSSPVSTMHCNDSCDLVSSNPNMPATSSASETVSQSISIGDFTTNEQKLQLYLKQHGFPYRVMRRNVGTDLEAGLQIYFELDVLDDNNKFICDTCTAERIEKQGYTEDLTTSIGLSKVSKQLGIASLPEILVLQIKRFFLGHRVSKYTAAISFPLILDMAPYCTNECLKDSADSNTRVLYGLYGVIEHRGHGLLGGHYVAYLRRRNKKINTENTEKPLSSHYNEEEVKSGEWFLANDCQITKVPGGFDEVKRRQAYILFYERLSVH